MRFSPSVSVRRLVSPLLIAGALVGGQLIAEKAASAQALQVVPPAVQIDVIPPRPSIWVPTYWGWHHAPRFACDARWGGSWSRGWGWGAGGGHWSHGGRQWHSGRGQGHWRR